LDIFKTKGSGKVQVQNRQKLNGRSTRAHYWFCQATSEFEKAKEFISRTNAIRTLLFFAKINFEWMEFQDSIRCLNKALDYEKLNNQPQIQDELIDPYWFDLANVHLLQISAFLNLPAKNWQQLYGKVTLMRHNEPRFLLNQHHALLLADARIYNLEKSKIRLLNFIKEGLIKEDLSIGLADLLELLILETKSFELSKHKNIVNLFLKSPSRDNYERALNLILRSITLTDEIVAECLIQIATDNPLGQYKILNVLALIVENADTRSELQNRIFQMTSCLSSRNRLLLSLRNPQNSENELEIKQKITIEIYENLYVLSRGVAYELPKHILFPILVSHFQTESFIDFETLIQRTWGVEFNLTYFRRVWSAVKRINEILQVGLAGLKPFYVKKNGVYLNEKIKIIVLCNTEGRAI
jgi:hypothetical protein